MRMTPPPPYRARHCIRLTGRLQAEAQLERPDLIRHSVKLVDDGRFPRPDAGRIRLRSDLAVSVELACRESAGIFKLCVCVCVCVFSRGLASSH